MKMVFSDGLYRPMRPQSQVSNQKNGPQTEMASSKRNNGNSRFDMNKSMKLKKTGCRSCSGVR